MQIHQLILIAALAAGCKKDVDKQVDEKPDLIEDGKKGVRWLAEKAEQEEDSYTAQKTKLDKAVADVQAHIADGKLDNAEAKLADIHWTPRGQGLLSDSDKKLIEIYDDKRNTLRGVIDRKRR